jgi:hypothetical protein
MHDRNNPYTTYLRNFALGRRNLPVHSPDLRSNEDRAVALAALGLAAGAAGAETPLPRRHLLR